MVRGSVLRYFLACAALVAPSASLTRTALQDEARWRQDKRLCARNRIMPPCETTLWRAAANASSSEICLEGKSLPKLYVLGVQKSSTSSLATDLSCTGVQPVAGTDDKEFHFFDGHAVWEGDEAERVKWLTRLPECGTGATIRGEQTDLGRLVADFTPNNFRMVEGEHTYSGIKVNVPQTIKKWYGADLARQLTFVIMVREPLARMQSAWYAASICGHFKAICRDDCVAPDFQQALGNVLANATKKDPYLSEWIWTSLYGRHLEQWLQEFPASQLYIVPYKQYSMGNADAICETISEMTRFNIDCVSNGKQVTHLWASGHKPLSEDMNPQLLSTFKKVMIPENKRFLKFLAEGHRNGLRLANYNGLVGNENQIKAWLEAGW